MTELGFPNFDKDISSVISDYYVEKPVKFRDYFLNNINALKKIDWYHIYKITNKIQIDYIYNNYTQYID